ncbi:MAG: DUF192 domain-containing protein [Acidimicrobiales bacterium]
MAAADKDVWLLIDGTPVALEVAATFVARLRGLIGRDGIGGAFLLQPARGVHTFGMRFDLDVAYLDTDLRVLSVETLATNRVGRRARGTRRVLEAQAGSFEKWGLKPGSELVIPSREAAAGGRPRGCWWVPRSGTSTTSPRERSPSWRRHR